ncbi:MAG: hypothetical protein HY927_08840 [Elusimicrobia bacterium]|nr:hypothetical protein [Elusimicrobiota bacterium]
MNIILAVFSIMTALVPPAQAQEPSPCGRRGQPTFTGSPFLPLACPGSTLQAPVEPPPAKALESKKPDKKLFEPKPLIGRWEGITMYGNLRYEVFLEVWKENRKTYSAVFMAKNYRTHVKHALHAVGKPGKERGEYLGETKLLSWPAPAIGTVVRFSPAPADAAKAKWDRQASVQFEGKAGRHLVRFSIVGKDKIAYSYEDWSGRIAPQTVKAEGELARTKRDSL